MPSERLDPVLFAELSEGAERSATYMEGVTFEHFQVDDLRRDAVCMRLIVIGEAANRLSPEAKSRLPDMNWRGMAGLRHLLAHDYGSASPSLLWGVATISAPQLAAALAAMDDH